MKFQKAHNELWLAADPFQMARTRVMPGAGWRREILPFLGELKRRRRQLRGIEAVGRSLRSLPMRELVQREEAPEILARDSCSPWDMEVLEEHRVAHLQMAIHMPGVQNCPGAGGLQHLFPSMPFGHCRRLWNTTWHTYLRMPTCALSTYSALQLCQKISIWHAKSTGSSPFEKSALFLL